MEYKNIRFKNAAVDVDSRTFTGYASVFGNRDSYSDVVKPGAFSKTIAERKDKIKVMYNHSFTIGRALDIEETSKGLFVKGYISETTMGNDVLTLIKDGAIDELSIGYEAIKWENEDNGGKAIRNLTEIKLYEFSPVDFAANDQALITGIKALAFSRGVKIDAERIAKGMSELQEPQTALQNESMKSLVTSDIILREEFERKLRLAKFNLI